MTDAGQPYRLVTVTVITEAPQTARGRGRQLVTGLRRYAEGMHQSLPLPAMRLNPPAAAMPGTMNGDMGDFVRHRLFQHGAWMRRQQLTIDANGIRLATPA